MEGWMEYGIVVNPLVEEVTTMGRGARVLELLIVEVEVERDVILEVICC